MTAEGRQSRTAGTVVEPRRDEAGPCRDAEPYPDNAAHLTAELDKLEALLRLRLAAFGSAPRMRFEASGQTLYISHDEVDGLLREGADEGGDAADLTALRQRLETLEETVHRRTEASVRAGVDLRLPRLSRLFGLSPLEAQTVLVGLAPELRRKCDTLYAYLQDDVTRKRPSVDLALQLLCPSEAHRWHARTLFSATAPLLRFGILRPVEDPASPSGSSALASFLELDPRILHFLLAQPTLDARLIDLVCRRTPAARAGEEVGVPHADRLRSLVESHFSVGEAPPGRLVIHLHGTYGAGRRELALSVCAGLGCPLLSLDVGRLLAREGEPEASLRLALRESVLSEAPLMLEGADVLTGGDARGTALLKGLEQAVAEIGWLLFLAGDEPWTRPAPFAGAAFHSLHLAPPPVAVRERIWRRALEESAATRALAGAAGTLAERFRLGPGQIRDAAAAAVLERALDGRRPLAAADLAAACRGRSTLKLGELSMKIRPCYRWTDLVLPEAQKAQLAELGDQVKHRHRVYGEWGFGEKLAHGRAVSALFTGPPGTGKTMAAEVLAHDLGLDLYKIDLSRVVSKYIGETEKNLSRIFDEAERGDVILFFDEADALFGKRTAVSDAHDRYANIEVSYLLQKMEEYDGVVILASNLRSNMDEAFLRRIRHVVEFPFPDAESRQRIWRTHFPDAAPVAAEVDCELLAERLKVAGGHIRNIVVNAAFLAAADGGVIGMEHVLRGARREFDKIGKRWDERSSPGSESAPSRR